jgi:hypothetical protein
MPHAGHLLSSSMRTGATAALRAAIECGEMAAVEDSQAATRVEVQLTPNEESRFRRRRLAGTGAGVVADDHSGDVSSPEVDAWLTAKKPAVAVERRTLAIGATVVAVAAFSLGWALGRSGGSSGSEQAQAEASAADIAPSETPLFAEVPTTVPVRTTPVVRAGPTTTFSGWQTETVEVHPALAALELVVVMVGGTQIAELETTSGELRTLTLKSGIVQPPVVDAGSDWFAIRSFESDATQLVRDGAPPVAVPILDVWSSHFQPDTGMFWQAGREYDATAPLGVVEVDHEGNETGRRFEVAGGVWPAAPDPAGGVVVSATGGTYHAGPEGSQLLTTGNLVALSRRVALETDCGQDIDNCGMYVVDRASGARTKVVPTDAEAGAIDILDVQSPAFWSSPELMGAISPDDRWAPMVLSNDQQRFGLIDLTTGRFTELGADPPSGWWWSPDGRFAIYNQDSDLKLFDTQQLITIAIAPQGIAVEAFAVRTAA